MDSTCSKQHFLFQCISLRNIVMWRLLSWILLTASLLQVGLIIAYCCFNAVFELKIHANKCVVLQLRTANTCCKLHFKVVTLLIKAFFLERAKNAICLNPETHCTIFSCPRRKTGIVKQSRRFLIGHDCFTMPIFRLGQPKTVQCV